MKNALTACTVRTPLVSIYFYATAFIYIRKCAMPFCFLKDLVDGSRLSKLLNCIIEDQNSLLPDTGIIPNGD